MMDREEALTRREPLKDADVTPELHVFAESWILNQTGDTMARMTDRNRMFVLALKAHLSRKNTISASQARAALNTIREVEGRVAKTPILDGTYVHGAVRLKVETRSQSETDQPGEQTVSAEFPDGSWRQIGTVTTLGAIQTNNHLEARFRDAWSSIRYNPKISREKS